MFHREVCVKVYDAEKPADLEILGENDDGVLQELGDPSV